MKLIDLLVQELPKRGGGLRVHYQSPKIMTVRCAHGTQNDPHYEGFSWEHHTGNSLMHFWYGEKWATPLSSDHKESIVTYWQYKASLAASQKPAWNGEGVPPVGCECEYISNGTSWGKVKVIGLDGEKIVIRPSDEIYYAITPSNKDVFIPFRTEAERKHEAVLESICAVLEMVAQDYKREDEAKLIYEAIAAGKIPGVKLED